MGRAIFKGNETKWKTKQPSDMTTPGFEHGWWCDLWSSTLPLDYGGAQMMPWRNETFVASRWNIPQTGHYWDSFPRPDCLPLVTNCTIRTPLPSNVFTTFLHEMSSRGEMLPLFTVFYITTERKLASFEDLFDVPMLTVCDIIPHIMNISTNIVP